MRTHRLRWWVATLLLASLAVLAVQPALALVALETKLVASDAAYSDHFGAGIANGVAVSGDTMVAGAYLDDHGGGVDAGSAYVFVRSMGLWTQEAKLVASDAAPNDLFGQSVSIDGDVIAVGSFMDDDRGSHSGSVYVYRRSGGVWTQEAKLTASDGADGDELGISVAIFGNTLVAGAAWSDARGADSGAVYVYRWNGSGWVQEAKLVPSDGIAGDLFGRSVALNGDTVVAGALLADAPAVDSGAAYVFRWNGTAWVQEAKLLASDGSKEDYFGFSASVYGDTAVVGAYRWGPGNSERGAAYVFRRSGTVWAQESKLTPADGTPQALFGRSVSIYGERVVIGSPAAVNGGVRTGAAYLFSRAGTVWTQELRLVASDGASNDRYGEAVSSYGNTVGVGAPQNAPFGIPFAGAAYMYDLT
ncbi:MAG: FG-GAP repeat protein [Chloroflexi bacterium]|nr:FG-GAP repeat protein [Chloroflexota bacterium]